MRSKIYLLAIVALFSGCTSTKAIYKNYDSLVSPGNSVNAEQAKIIAQRMLIDTEEKDSYRISYPDVKTGDMVYKYPNFWFVVFGHNLFEPMTNDAINPTYRDLLQTEFLVVIDKKNGKIAFFGEWYPKRENDFDWVFDLHAYNRKDLLALPPYKQARELF